MNGTPTTDADRIAHYNAKTTATTVGLKIASRLSGMKATFADFAGDFTAMQGLVRGELGTDPAVFPLDYGSYYAYAGELWRLKNTATQPAVDAVAQIIKTKWTTRQLKSAMLVSIALNVFSITVI